jgi:hypothetical protein
MPVERAFLRDSADAGVHIDGSAVRLQLSAMASKVQRIKRRRVM